MSPRQSRLSRDEAGFEGDRSMAPRHTRPRPSRDEAEFDRSRQLGSGRAVIPVSADRDSSARPSVVVTQLFGWGVGRKFS